MQSSPTTKADPVFLGLLGLCVLLTFAAGFGGHYAATHLWPCDCDAWWGATRSDG